MSPREISLYRHAFAAVMLHSAAKADPAHFYPLNIAGGFPDFRPEGMFQAFLEALKLAKSREPHACGNCGRVEGSPDGGCDWQECPGHARATVGRDLGIEGAFLPVSERAYYCSDCGAGKGLKHSPRCPRMQGPLKCGDGFMCSCDRKGEVGACGNAPWRRA